jgi:O-acetylserine/cysteine efflux transporter
MPRRHAVLALVVAVCWAVNFVVIDIGLESFPPLLFAALRFGLTAFPAIFFVPRPDVRWPAVVAVGLFICVGQFGLLFVAMNTGLPAGLASVIAPLQPVFTIPLAAVALGERPSLRQVAGVAFAVAGIGAIAAGRAHGVPLQAVALGVASAASWGCGNVMTRAARTKRPFSLLVWSSVVAPVPLLGLSLIFEGSARWQSAASSIDASGIAALGYVVIVSTFFGYGVWYRLMSRHPGLDSRALHAARAGRRDHHRVARARRAPDLGRAARVSHRLGRPCARARARRRPRGTTASRRPSSSTHLVITLLDSSPTATAGAVC